MTASQCPSRQPIVSAWMASATAVVITAACLAVASRQFGYDTEVIDMPVLAVTSALVLAGLAFAAGLPRLTRASAKLSDRDTQVVLAIIVIGGLVARLVLFSSQPVLEDDYQRYLWDGAVTASGANPYALSPRRVVDAGSASRSDSSLSKLAHEAGPVLRRVNHPHLTTIYPPVAQAAFALAHLIKPWSLAAWRAVLLGCEIVTLLALFALLKHAGRSPLWSALYWWNPLVLKEIANSAHMDAVVVALVLLALVLAVNQRTLFATSVLAFAVATKLWPVLLLPLILRPIVGDHRRLGQAVTIFAGLTALAAAPMLTAGGGDHAGLVAYAQSWSTNSALFPLLNGGAGALLRGLGQSETFAPLIVRGLLAAALGAVAVVVALPNVRSPSDLITRASVLIAALVLLSPAQYPWYALWLTPFLAFWPNPAFLLMTAMLPLYYASFHFAARETLESALPFILALIWAPVWTALAFEVWRAHGSYDRERPAANVLQ